MKIQGLERIVPLPGWYRANATGESIHVGDDMEVFDRSLHEMKVELATLKPAELHVVCMGSSVRSARPEKFSAADRVRFRSPNRAK